MLQTEVNTRVPLALSDEDGPWRLLSWLNQIQPSLSIGRTLYPTYSIRLLIEHLKEKAPKTPEEAFAALLDIADGSIRAEEEHILKNINEIIDRTEDVLENRIVERLETLDIFIRELEHDPELASQSPRNIANALADALGLTLNLTGDPLRLLRDDPYAAREEIADQLVETLTRQSINRLMGAVNRRLDDTPDMDRNQLSDMEWEEMATAILSTIEEKFQKSRQRLIGDNKDGSVARELSNHIAKVEGEIDESVLHSLLMALPQGAITTFDSKTHRRVKKRTVLFNYTYYAAHFLEEETPEVVTEKVLSHLEGANHALQQAIGFQEWAQVSNSKFQELDIKSRKNLLRVLGQETIDTLGDNPLHTLDAPNTLRAVIELGRQTLTEVYRALLLGIISDLWIDYLTQMEALRVSIGLEAYAQRDPLVEYKTKAFEMFQQLFTDLRQRVVNRMFVAVRPGTSTVQTAVRAPTPSSSQGQKAHDDSTKKTRRGRRRRRKKK
jgi:preprotein translocase subunit SecA